MAELTLEQRQNALAEYAVLGQHIAPTAVIRFATFTAFVALNGALVIESLKENAIKGIVPLSLFCLLGVFWNIFLLLLEIRSVRAHQTITQRGAALETSLLIQGGIFTTTVGRTGWPIGHGRLFQFAYCVGVIAWIVVFANHLGWLRIPIFR